LRRNPSEGFIGLVIMMIVVGVLGLLFRSNFEQDSKLHGSILVDPFTLRKFSSKWAPVYFASLCAIFWFVLSDWLSKFLVPAPMLTLETIWLMLSIGTGKEPLGLPIWSDTMVNFWGSSWRDDAQYGASTFYLPNDANPARLREGH